MRNVIWGCPESAHPIIARLPSLQNHLHINLTTLCYLTSGKPQANIMEIQFGLTQLLARRTAIYDNPLDCRC